jgi:cytochrome oxidase Cu insertion factor (SCO1/SenC/PrrC family)
MTRAAQIALIAWIVALVAGAGWFVWTVVGERSAGGVATAPGAAAIGGPFSLVDQDGKPFTEANLKGKPTIIYFGFTYCPDVCPTSLLILQTALEQMGPEKAKKIRPVFMSVDPERDTPAVLKDYLGNVGPEFIGLTGSVEQVAAAAKAFRVYHQKVPNKAGDSYTVDHSSIFYVLDRNGRFVRHFTHESKPEQIRAALEQLL